MGLRAERIEKVLRVGYTRKKPKNLLNNIDFDVSHKGFVFSSLLGHVERWGGRIRNGAETKNIGRSE